MPPVPGEGVVAKKVSVSVVSGSASAEAKGLLARVEVAGDMANGLGSY
jgi:hypothetical protein